MEFVIRLVARKPGFFVAVWASLGVPLERLLGGSWVQVGSKFNREGARWPSKIDPNNNDILKALRCPIVIGLVIV